MHLIEKHREKTIEILFAPFSRSRISSVREDQEATKSTTG